MTSSFCDGHGAVTLTPRESEVLAQLRLGHSNKVIADRLGITRNTVRVMLITIYRKLGVRNRVGAAMFTQTGEQPR